jgi:hypothetical protein
MCGTGSVFSIPSDLILFCDATGSPSNIYDKQDPCSYDTCESMASTNAGSIDIQVVHVTSQNPQPVDLVLYMKKWCDRYFAYNR